MSDVKKLILLPSKVIEVEEEDGVKIYLNPHITANYNETDEFIRLEGSQGATAKIELSEIEEINNVPFAGSFADLRLLIDPIIVEANTTGDSSGSFPADYSNAPNQLSILSAIEQVRDFVEFDPEVISSVPFCSGGQQYYRVIISNLEASSGEPDDNLIYWVDPVGNVGTTAPINPEDGYCNINKSIDALYSGSTFDFTSPNSGSLTLPTLIGKIDIELIDATVIEIPTDINNRVLDVQDVIDVLNNYVQEVVFNRYSDDSQIVVFEDGNLSHNGIAAITIFNDDSSEFLKWDSFTLINEDLSSNEGKQRRALQKALSQQSTQKRSENHVEDGAQVSGAGVIPAGFYSVLIRRFSGTLVINGRITLNNQVRTYSFTAQQTDLTNGGTPQYNITGGGNWEWVAYNKLK